MASILLRLKLDSGSTDKPRIVILLGAPGSGKGTQAPLLSNFLKMPHISTGDLFRENIRNMSPVGKQAREFMDQGLLVPDEVVLAMLFSRLGEADCKGGAILDGFPRTLAQAEALDREIAATHELSVFYLAIDFDLLIERISGRLSCKQCGRSFHKKTSPPMKEGHCDSCGGLLFQREDDTKEMLSKRLAVYSEQTKPLIDYYRKRRGILKEIQADGSKEEILQAMILSLCCGKV